MAGKYQGVVDNFVRAAKEGHQAEVERNLGILVDPYKREWGGGNSRHVLVSRILTKQRCP